MTFDMLPGSRPGNRELSAGPSAIHRLDGPSVDQRIRDSVPGAGRTMVKVSCPEGRGWLFLQSPKPAPRRVPFFESNPQINRRRK